MMLPQLSPPLDKRNSVITWLADTDDVLKHACEKCHKSKMSVDYG